VFSEHAFAMGIGSGAQSVRYALAEVLDGAGEVHGMLGYATRA
jgi:hypothetical protein